MSDIFHDDVPTTFIDRILEVMSECPQHTFMVLTKRPERMKAYLSKKSPLPPSVWLGVTAENQSRADERIPTLLETPAAVHFVSYEPALSSVDFEEYLRKPTERICENCWQFSSEYEEAQGECGLGVEPDPWPNDAACPDFEDRSARDFTLSRKWLGRIDLILAGGETGPGARPAHPDWFRKVRDDCKAAGVSFFLKRLGEWREAQPDELPETRQAANFKDFRLICSKGWNWSSISADAMLNHQAHNYPDHFDAEGKPICNPIAVRRVGKALAGRLLDGREHNEMPVRAE
jgi:hypothetical protein